MWFHHPILGAEGSPLSAGGVHQRLRWPRHCPILFGLAVDTAAVLFSVPHLLKSMASLKYIELLYT